ncbi:metallophosphoesterase family protein [Lignipirellula cremea]|uniref:3',5'-cyclic adenosine monophosphate phosphodiesterase CpdA n=1 Tax=Lignipirellula cremea TaxID=2528010 RepID=A0A518DM56_9BACT|nr:metallophosphoesterase [Lignipirellula cremea]QDU92902.1 3',5'-cyclic adenosine monophosphate phosphodiesterase CpdA [Lignipirellula cremea]
MPAHLLAASRRQFLLAAGAGAATAVTCRAYGDDRSSTEEVVYLLNDTHIGEHQPTDSPVPSHLRQAVEELVKREQKPACVLINGDLALKDGQPGDYRHLARLLKPMRDAEIDVHVTLGNHDNREVFFEVLAEDRAEVPAVKSRQISIVETRFANFYLLDSLQETMKTPGVLGAEQLEWLASALDDRAEKPAIIVAHHNPRLGGDPAHFPGGLVDSDALWRLLAGRKQVKAYLHGHVHHRALAAHKGIHIINNLAISYVGNPAKSTTGWTIARLTADGMTMQTRTTDAKHAWHNEIERLVWRS